MALKLLQFQFQFPFPIFSPHPIQNPNPSFPSNHRQETEIRFARWNNANARSFNERRRAQQEIEDDIRRTRRFTAAENLANDGNVTPPSPTATNTPYFKSIGTPSSPSRPSIPGRKSKYSKPPETVQHPAFRRTYRIANLPLRGNEERINRKAEIRVGDDGVSYVIDGAPFEFKYSYTESPRVRPVKLREAPYSPFGPTDTPRPWTGRAPLPSSKKKLKEFDSFQLPPSNKKGVKPVQAPGPYLPGSGPRHVKTREEILGEPLTPEEVKDLVNGCLKSKRQLNMGRDGFTHNMLDNIHAHWKRRRVCKIKCKGVCTVDMENVCQQLEERTGGKIIYRKGGVVYLFRGRNYNFRTRPRFPLMLWKPVTPMYPRLIKRAPEGLTLEEAADMRKRGRKLTPICKLGKNGVYTNLVKHVKEAFEECELVRINCEGMNGSDYHKIGAKLKDLVPCVLVSFEREHILMWRGKDWKSSLRIPVNNGVEAMESSTDSTTTYAQFIEDPDTEMLSIKDASLSLQDIHTAVTSSGEQGQDLSVIGDQEQDVAMDTISGAKENCQAKSSSEDGGNSAFNESENINIMHVGESLLDDATHVKEMATASSLEYDTGQSSVESVEKLQDVSKSTNGSHQPEKLLAPYAEGVLRLREKAIESGSALILDDGNLDADNVYQSAVAFTRSAPPSPVFKHRPRKVAVQKFVNEESVHPEAKELTPTIENGAKESKSSKPNRTKRLDELLDEIPQSHGTLRIDELAKLLA